MQIKEKMKAIESHHNALEQEHHLLTTDIARLTQEGCLNAKEHWREEKYLYLLFPMKGGQRKKDYIGNHPLRITEARKKLKNYKTRLVCIQRQESIQSTMREIETVIHTLFALCSDKSSGQSDNPFSLMNQVKGFLAGSQEFYS